ncbi:hypothetical protein [Mesorhizobium sp. LSJC265A00]|uniref:hypothetical protein n=1 Tax=Mesorhizobium sp. LSJC265A00 TaxID=1287322 RepID=UPI0012EC0F25|nr:hypothetical protein [Mesorhizobium sp. LSJC265A00]
MEPPFNYRLDGCDFAGVLSREFDLFIYTVGYERRSAHLRGMINAKGNAAYLYGSSGVMSYDQNLEKFKSFKDTHIHDGISSFKNALQDVIQAKGSAIRVAIDVSCMNRSLLAQCFTAVKHLSDQIELLTVLYAPGKFLEPSGLMMPVRYFGPAIPSMVADVGEPYLGRYLIMGLGYEYGAALSAIEMIEPDYGFYFSPLGHSEAFEPAVRKANFDFDFGISGYRVQPYHVDRPVDLHGMLRDIIDVVVHKANVSIVPFGPKIFSSVALLLALKYPKRVSFLRYSISDLEFARDVEPDDYTSQYDVRFHLDEFNDDLD